MRTVPKLLLSIGESVFPNSALIVGGLGRVALASVLMVGIETMKDLTMEDVRS
jgi:hypothetical protein